MNLEIIKTLITKVTKATFGNIYKKNKQTPLTKANNPNSTVLCAKRKVLAEAYADPVFAPRLVNANSLAEIAEILSEFCEANGYKVKRVELP
jgi:ethanolamine utilization protein EutP (predicted NTPase)